MGEEAATEKIITVYFSKHIRNEEEGVNDYLSHQKRFLRGSDMEQGTEGWVGVCQLEEDKIFQAMEIAHAKV